MTAYRFVDAKGFLARPTWRAFALSKDVEKIKSLITEEVFVAAFPPKKLEQLKEALDIFANMPLINLRNTDNGYDIFLGSYWNSSTPIMAYTVVGHDQFTTASGSMRATDYYPSNNQSQWGLEQAIQLKPYVSVLEKAWDILKLIDKNERQLDPFKSSGKLSSGVLKKAAKFKEQMDQGLVKVKEDNPMLDLVHADCFAVYLGQRGNPGFLDGRSGTSPIAGARLFESQASAEKTIKSRGLTDATVVKIKAQMVSLADGHKATNSMGPLQEALAVMQKQAILDALASATDEQLEEVIQARRPTRKM